jgi:hypothetical protein
MKDNMEETLSANRQMITFGDRREAAMILNRGSVLLCSLLTFVVLGGVRPSAAGPGGRPGVCDKMKPCQLLSQSDAEKVLGQSARLTQDTSELRGDVRQCLCAYKGASIDKASGQDSLLFFSLEENEANPSTEQASQVLTSTKEANAHDSSIWDLKGVGDEAFLLSNDSASHLIMARRAAIIMRLQVKRAAGTKSLEELKAFAEKVFKHL